jgi:hypothetical protein
MRREERLKGQGKVAGHAHTQTHTHIQTLTHTVHGEFGRGADSGGLVTPDLDTTDVVHQELDGTPYVCACVYVCVCVCVCAYVYVSMCYLAVIHI